MARPPESVLRKMSFSTESSRLETFSDGVLAVIITIVVLERKPPREIDFQSFRSVLPTLAAYVTSFILLGISWNSHHHMLRATIGIDGRAMWANRHLLFWLSRVAFTTTWLGENLSAPVPTAPYASVLLLTALTYTLRQNALLAPNGRKTGFANAVKTDVKGTISRVFYLCTVGFAFVSTRITDITANRC